MLADASAAAWRTDGNIRHARREASINCCSCCGPAKAAWRSIIASSSRRGKNAAVPVDRSGERTPVDGGWSEKRKLVLVHDAKKHECCQVRSGQPQIPNTGTNAVLLVCLSGYACSCALSGIIHRPKETKMLTVLEVRLLHEPCSNPPPSMATSGLLSAPPSPPPPSSAAAAAARSRRLELAS